MLLLLLAACTETGAGAGKPSDAPDTDDTAVPAALGPATGCPAFTSYDVVGRAASYVLPGSPDSDWVATLDVSELGDDGRFTVVTWEGTEASHQEVTWTRSCDADGVWLYGYTSVFTVNGTSYGADEIVLDRAYHELPAALAEGTTWTDRMVGTVTSDGVQSPYQGPLDEYTVAETATVQTEAGAFDAVFVRHLQHFGGGEPDAVQYNGRHYDAVAGLVAVDSGGTETGRVLAETNAL